MFWRPRGDPSSQPWDQVWVPAVGIFHGTLNFVSSLRFRFLSLYFLAQIPKALKIGRGRMQLGIFNLLYLHVFFIEIFCFLTIPYSLLTSLGKLGKGQATR